MKGIIFSEILVKIKSTNVLLIVPIQVSYHRRRLRRRRRRRRHRHHHQLIYSIN